MPRVGSNCSVLVSGRSSDLAGVLRETSLGFMLKICSASAGALCCCRLSAWFRHSGELRGVLVGANSFRFARM